MRKLIQWASGLVAAAALMLVLGAAPASAATGVGVIELSTDGVSFARNLPGALFGSIATLSPGDSETKTIYVRNTGTATGYLRVTLRDVSFSDSHFANALTVTTSTPSISGASHAISGASPCLVTNEGLLIAPGQTVPVTSTLTLGDLFGSQGQGATASMSLRFALSDTTPGSLPATHCGNSGSTVPLLPGTSSPTTTTPPEGDTTALAVPAPRPNPAVTDTSANANANAANELTPTFPTAFALDPNTWRLYQEYLVLILFVAVLIGAGISWLVGRRKRRDREDV